MLLRVTMTGSLLLEILVALALSLIALTAVITVMSNTLEHSHYQTTVFSLQRQFMRLSQLFYHEIGLAGYRGCLRWHDDNDLQIRHSDAIPADWLGKGYHVKDGTMAIRIQRMAAWHDYLLLDHTPHQNQWTLSNHQRLKVGDQVMVADCDRAQITTVMATSLQADRQIITTSAIDAPFAAGSYFGLWQSETFYVAKTDRVTTQGYPIWGLYSYEGGKTYEWADGVNDLQFSVMTDDKAHALLVAHILLSSVERVTHRVQTYFFAGQSYRSHDGHLYRALEVDISLQPEMS